MSSDEKRVRLIEAAATLLDATVEKRLNTVALNKALFYLDLVSLRDSGEVFTRNSYIALEQGPVVAKYQDRLIKSLERSGIATQAVEGSAKPVRLLRLPEFTRINPTVRAIAVKVSRWWAKSSAELSSYSHDNPGWIIACEEAKPAGGSKKPIDMNIAMQQIVDDDPWTTEPLDAIQRAACEIADTLRGNPW